MRGPTLALTLVGLLVLAVAGWWGIDAWLNGSGEAQEQATAIMRNAAGDVLGAIQLQQLADGVALRGELRGLPPGPHGLHFHERGACEPDFSAAGDHYDPHGRKHGLRNPEGPHAGDLPNLMVGADGRATVDLVTPRVTLRGGEAPLLDADGTGLVVHEGEDDQVTDPSGKSGARIACGVVTAGVR